MRFSTFSTFAAIAVTACCATLASAQNPASRAAAGDRGFFRPAADPNLTAPRPAEIASPPSQPVVAAEPAPATAESSGAPDAAKVLQWTERQMDRSEQAAQRAKPAPGTPAPINGAFTGSTNPRDR